MPPHLPLETGCSTEGSIILEQCRRGRKKRKERKGCRRLLPSSSEEGAGPAEDGPRRDDGDRGRPTEGGPPPGELVVGKGRATADGQRRWTAAPRALEHGVGGRGRSEDGPPRRPSRRHVWGLSRRRPRRWAMQPRTAREEGPPRPTHSRTGRDEEMELAAGQMGPSGRGRPEKAGPPRPARPRAGMEVAAGHGGGPVGREQQEEVGCRAPRVLARGKLDCRWSVRRRTRQPRTAIIRKCRRAPHVLVWGWKLPLAT
jgi:hypothetical protein